jgi:Trypsin
MHWQVITPQSNVQRALIREWSHSNSSERAAHFPDCLSPPYRARAKGIVSARIGYGSVDTPIVIGISSSYTHPSWNFDTSAFDVMVVKLVRSTNLQWVTLNSDSSFPSTSKAVEIEALGIGRTSIESAALAGNLQIKPMIAISSMSCNALIRSGNAAGPYYDILIRPDQGCFTDYYMKFGGQCKGDEGGPMVEYAANVIDDRLVAVMST